MTHGIGNSNNCCISQMCISIMEDLESSVEVCEGSVMIEHSI